jgi:ribose 5-phosphate isomerase B
MEKGIIFAIGCDHAGYQLKEELKSVIRSYGFDFKDYGTFSADSVDYPDFAIPVCQAVEQGANQYGILICGTGNGMAMTANKFRGIRAALCWKPVIAEFARLHNDANILVLPSRHIDLTEAEAILESFIESNFEGGRHCNRVEKMGNASYE